MKPINSILLFLVVHCLACSGEHGHSREGAIRAGGLSVSYADEGSGPAILFLHAGLQDRQMWSPQVDELRRSFRIITMDLPFHGKTEGFDTTILVADVIRIVLDSLRIEKLSVAGLSMGSVAALEFALAYPERIEKLIMLSAGVNGYEKQQPPDSLTMAWYPKMLGYLQLKDTAAAAAVFAKAWAEGPYRDTAKLDRPVTAQVYKTTLSHLRKHKLRAWPKLAQPPAVERLGGLRKPLLIIHGDQDLPYVGLSSKFLESVIPGSKRIEMKGVAHMFNLEQPREVNRYLREFLK